MYEWYYDFLHDSNTFGATIWLAFVLIILVILIILTWRDFK